MLLSTHSSPLLLPTEASFAIWYVCGGALCAVGICVLWALLERSERLRVQSQNEKLSNACSSITEHHYRERVAAEERHLLAHDSAVRNILEHLERALLGKPKA